MSEKSLKEEINLRMIQFEAYLIENKKIKPRGEFAEKIKTNASQWSEIKANKKFVTSEMIGHAAREFPELNANWLVTGEGGMVFTTNYDQTLAAVLERQTPNIYYVPNPATAGIFSKGHFDYQHQHLDQIHLPGFEGGEDKFLFKVDGESMYPFISNGDYVVCVQINSIEDIKPGFAYVICTSNMLVVKRVEKSKKANHLLLVSDNAKVQKPYDQHMDDITQIFLVKGVVTMNTSKRIIL